MPYVSTHWCPIKQYYILTSGVSIRASCSNRRTCSCVCHRTDRTVLQTAHWNPDSRANLKVSGMLFVWHAAGNVAYIVAMALVVRRWHGPGGQDYRMLRWGRGGCFYIKTLCRYPANKSSTGQGACNDKIYGA